MAKSYILQVRFPSGMAYAHYVHRGGGFVCTQATPLLRAFKSLSQDEAKSRITQQGLWYGWIKPTKDFLSRVFGTIGPYRPYSPARVKKQKRKNQRISHRKQKTAGKPIIFYGYNTCKG